MADLEYLMRRLRELYSHAALTGERVADKYLLIVVETEHTGELVAMEDRLTTLHLALRYAFVAGEPIVTIPPRRAVALAATYEPRLSDSLARLRSELELAIGENQLPSTRCWSQSLPRDPVELSLVMLEVEG